MLSECLLALGGSPVVRTALVQLLMSKIIQLAQQLWDTCEVGYTTPQLEITVTFLPNKTSLLRDFLISGKVQSIFRTIRISDRHSENGFATNITCWSPSVVEWSIDQIKWSSDTVQYNCCCTKECCWCHAQ